MDETTKKKATRRKYDEAFKKQAVALVQTSGRSLSQVAAELGVSHWNLRDWREIYGQRSTPAQMAEQIEGLRRELDEVRGQRDALKKALGILSTPSGNASRK
jgi:transposase